MPHIRVRGAKDTTVAQISSQANSLAELIGTSSDNFTFESVQTKFFESGSQTSGYPFVEVLWFARSDVVKQKVADFVTEVFRSSEPGSDVAVVFVELKPESYFENGKHF